MAVVVIAIHTESKTAYHPSLVDHVLKTAARHAAGVESPVGVFMGQRVVGLVRGRSGSRDVHVRRITHRQWCGFDGYDDLNAALRNGAVVRTEWRKDISAGWTRANVWGDYWPVAGSPVQGDYGGTANTARQFSQTTTGAMTIRSKTPAGGETRHFVGATMCNGAVVGTTAQFMWLYDRVLSYDGCSISPVLTTLTNTLTAQRYAGSGEIGNKILVTCSAALGAVASNLSSMTVTDNAGNTAVSLAPGYTLPWWTSAPAGSTTAPAPVCLPHDNVNAFTIAPFLPLPAGVSGVRAVEAFTSSVINTGTVCIALVQPLAWIWQPVNQTVIQLDTPRATFQMPRIFDTACLNMLHLGGHGSAATVNNVGHLRIAHS